MSLVLTSEKYNTLNALYANGGDWIDGELTFYSRFDYLSSTGAPATYNNTAGIFSLTLPTGATWSSYGFAVGDAINCIFSVRYRNPVGPDFFVNQDILRNITYISGNILQMDGDLEAQPVDPNFDGEIQNNRKFPEVNITGELTIVKTSPADEIEVELNLTPNGSTSLNSVIDGEIMRFKSAGISSMVVLDTIPLVQIGDKSGGYFDNVDLTFESESAGWPWYRYYKLTYNYINWGIIQDGFNEPDYYTGGDALAPIANVKLLGEIGNPNTAQEVTSTNTQANTGGFDENYNGGVNNYTPVSIDWFDYLGDPISAMDYSNICTFDAIITAPFQDTLLSNYRVGVAFRPIDTTVYKNLPSAVVNNLMMNVPEVDYQHSATPAGFGHMGFANDDGAALAISEMWFFLVGTTLRVRGKITPTAPANTYFNQFPDGARRVTLWISLGNHLTDGTESSDRVSLKIFDQDIIDAPTLGVQVPDVATDDIIDHNGKIVSAQVTTEDDVLYVSTFQLSDGINYEGVRAKITIYNPSTLDEFDLEETLFSFSGVVNVAGQFQPNIIIPRGFLLPPATDRNLISLTRLPALDVAGKYGLKLSYGFLSRWQYWLAQLNADSAFYNVAEPNDGLNQNWERYESTAPWLARISFFTIVDGVEDFNYHTVDLRPYEDSNVTATSINYTVLSDGSTPAALVADELIRVDAVFTWNAGDFVNPWATVALENFEGGRVGFLSSVLPQGGVASNVLEPVSGSVGLDLAVAPSNIITLTFIVDTSKVVVDEVSLSYRLYSDDAIIGKQKTDGTLKQKTDSTIKLKA